MENFSLCIKNVNVFNVYLKKFLPATVYIKEEKFFYIDYEQAAALPSQRVLDADGMFLLPGLTDIHMHIESSMIPPTTFGSYLSSCGVTTIVSEPHEIANVKGIRGILEMISAGENSPIDIYYGIPSSVPSTNESLETTGAVIDFTAMKHLLEEKDVKCVGEIMNYRQIIQENNLEITKFLHFLEQEHPGYVIEGHCPSLTGLDLASFLFLGINGDHTEHTLEEVKQRMMNGMFFEIQEKMLKPEILDYIKENHLYEHCCFVTDDTMADVLYENGQLNYVVQKAIAMGFPLEEAIYCSTYTPCQRMHLYDRGAIAPGKLADFMLVKDPSCLRPEAVYKNGQLIFSKNRPETFSPPDIFPKDFYESVILPDLSPEDFQIRTTIEHGSARVRAIEILPDRTQTKETHITIPVENYRLKWENSGCLLAMVLERHGKNGNIGYGLITGSCLQEGTAATTYFHDHHNLFVAGSNSDDMYLAVKRIQKMQGGFLILKDGNILSELPLPICGILSASSLEDTAHNLKKIRSCLQELGYRHNNPIMSLATLGLPVSPALKLTDKGIVDVKESKVVPLILSESEKTNEI
jgi:adenine deaminase